LCCNAPTMLPAGSMWVHYTTSCNTQSSAPEDGRDHSPRHVELIGIINKPLLLHLVGVCIIYLKLHFYLNFLWSAVLLWHNYSFPTWLNLFLVWRFRKRPPQSNHYY